jgi:hypothetical protein
LVGGRHLQRRQMALGKPLGRSGQAMLATMSAAPR